MDPARFGSFEAASESDVRNGVASHEVIALAEAFVEDRQKARELALGHRRDGVVGGLAAARLEEALLPEQADPRLDVRRPEEEPAKYLRAQMRLRRQQEVQRVPLREVHEDRARLPHDRSVVVDERGDFAGGVLREVVGALRLLEVDGHDLELEPELAGGDAHLHAVGGGMEVVEFHERRQTLTRQFEARLFALAGARTRTPSTRASTREPPTAYEPEACADALRSSSSGLEYLRVGFRTIPMTILRRPLLAVWPALAACSAHPEPAPGIEPVRVVQSQLVSPLIVISDGAGAKTANRYGTVDVAYGGGVYLATWSGSTISGTGSPYGAAFIGTDGHLIDPQPATLARSTPGSVTPAHVAFDGTNFHVLWQDGATLAVSAAGQIVTPLTLLSGIDIGFAQSFACSATTCAAILYSYGDGGLSYVIDIARFSLTGQLLDSAPIEVPSAGAPSQWMSRVVATPSGFVAAWTDESWTVGTVALDATGTPMGSAAAVSTRPTADRFLDSVASNGSELLLVREQDTTASGGGTPQCYGLRLGLDGSALDAMLTSFATGVPCAVVASDGDTFLSTGRDPNDELAAEISAADSAGTVVTTPGAGEPAASLAFPAMASDGTHYLQVWPAYTGVQTTLFDAHGTVVVPPTDVVFDPLTITTPAVASNGGAFLAVWSDDRASGNNGVYGTSVGLDGSVLARGLPLAPNANVDTDTDTSHGPPAVGSNGSSYLVAWPVASAGVDATLVSSSGSPSASFHVSGAARALAPSVASDGTGFLVAWIDPRNLVSDVYVARVDSMGNVLDATGVDVTTASSAVNDTVYPQVAWTGKGYAIAYRHKLASSTSAQSQYDVELAVVSDTGAMLAAPTAVSTGQTDDDDVHLACAPAECLVAWTSDQEVWIQRVDPMGALIGTAAVVQGAQAAPRLAWDGTAFVITALDDAAVTEAHWIALDESLEDTSASLASDAGVGNGGSNYALASNGAGTNLVVESTGGKVYAMRLTNDLAPPPDAGGGLASDAGPGVIADATASSVEAGEAPGDGAALGPAGDASSGSASGAGASGGAGATAGAAASENRGGSGCGCTATGNAAPCSWMAGAVSVALLGMRRRGRRARVV
jgi:hypothetical protein